MTVTARRRVHCGTEPTPGTTQLTHNAYRIMTQPVRPFGLILLAMFVLIAADSAVAATAPSALDFGLHLARMEVTLDDATQTVNTTVKRIGIVTFDSGRPSVQPGLAVGYAYVSDDSPAGAGLERQGFYIAPALRGVLLATQRIMATITGSYLYQRTKDNNVDQAVTSEWLQAQLDLDLRYRLSGLFNLALGGHYGRIDVDEQLSGAVDRTLTRHTGPSLGYHAGLEIDLDEDGQVGISVHHALGDGVELYFQRQF